MEELATLVERSRSGDLAAFEALVRRFQDMACGYAYSILGDFHLAEDAAQEAFVDAYGKLEQLREPKAFAGWFRRIVFKHCDRVMRRKRVPTVPLEAAPDASASCDTPAQQVERRELAEQVLEAVSSLPEHQRTATALFYINGYSQNDIAEFLEVPVTTVKKRLHDSRKRLKERLLIMVEDTLKQNAPDERFSQKVIDELLHRPKPMEMESHPVRQALDAVRGALPEYEFVEGDEVIPKQDPEGVYDSHDHVYHRDDDTILRSCTTITTIRAAIGRKPPVRIMTAGRVFRPDKS
ncbi:MAG: sigma-70 family RNA polymerase sigma factor, partial [bacterium]|nr:sigma-70 family RNA polymerase sigma factor [bacterium]